MSGIKRKNVSLELYDGIDIIIKARSNVVFVSFISNDFIVYKKEIHIRYFSFSDIARRVKKLKSLRRNILDILNIKYSHVSYNNILYFVKIYDILSGELHLVNEKDELIVDLLEIDSVNHGG